MARKRQCLGECKNFTSKFVKLPFDVWLWLEQRETIITFDHFCQSRYLGFDLSAPANDLPCKGLQDIRRQPGCVKFKLNTASKVS